MDSNHSQSATMPGTFCGGSCPEVQVCPALTHSPPAHATPSSFNSCPIPSLSLPPCLPPCLPASAAAQPTSLLEQRHRHARALVCEHPSGLGDVCIRHPVVSIGRRLRGHRTMDGCAAAARALTGAVAGHLERPARVGGWAGIPAEAAGASQAESAPASAHQLVFLPVSEQAAAVRTHEQVLQRKQRRREHSTHSTGQVSTGQLSAAQPTAQHRAAPLTARHRSTTQYSESRRTGAATGAGGGRQVAAARLQPGQLAVVDDVPEAGGAAVLVGRLPPACGIHPLHRRHQGEDAPAVHPAADASTWARGRAGRWVVACAADPAMGGMAKRGGPGASQCSKAAKQRPRCVGSRGPA